MASPIRKILDLPNDSIKKTLFVALALCLVCSILVSAAAVMLKPLQDQNKALDKKKNILEIAGLMQEGKSIDELFSQIEPRIIDMTTGEYVTDVDVATYDQRKAANDPAQNIVLKAEDDIAGIKRRAKYTSVYLVKDGEKVKSIILPVHGYGLWSTLYGFLALESDAKTVVGLGFYEHAETPGLGGEVDNPGWRKKWVGKQVYNEAGDVVIRVIKGHVDSSTPNAESKVDGLSGATLTSRGVDNMLHYWLGKQGYTKYLNNIRKEGAM
ncbi:MAG: Na(+)-translocating NADH-quinone reductase subunit C [Thiotrichales bacterium]|nr:MAG: Na(+)-translocating NADH-quinone reductase subunit C [Thiotrichales bacterium]